MDESLLDRLLPGIADATAHIASRRLRGLCDAVLDAHESGLLDLRERDALQGAIDSYTAHIDCGYMAAHLLQCGFRDDRWYSRRAMLWQRWAIGIVKQVQKETYGHG